MKTTILLFIKFFSKNWQLIIIFFLAFSFFFASSFLNYNLEKDGWKKWISPDESANYLFTKLYARQGDLRLYINENIFAKDLIHPRSIRSDSGELKPVSFLGIILIYGSLSGSTSLQVIPFLTPFFASLGIIIYFLFLRRIFNSFIAFNSTLLLAFFPVYFYYSGRSMFHNVPFTVFMLFALYFLTFLKSSQKKIKLQILKKWQEKAYEVFFSFEGYAFFKNFIFTALAGFFFGLAIITRASELIWILPIFILILFFNWRALTFFRIIIFSSFLFLALLPNFYWNQILYGAPWNGGYPQMNDSLAEIKKAGDSILNYGSFQASWDIVQKNIFYFGFKALESWNSFYIFFIKMFYWLFWPAIFGLAWYFENWRHQEKKVKIYLITYIILSLILIFYYGSWQFSDNVNPNEKSLADSYTRYWLPIYLGAIPLAVLFFQKLALGFWQEKRKLLIFKRDKFTTFNSGDAFSSFQSFLRVGSILKRPVLQVFKQNKDLIIQKIKTGFSLRNKYLINSTFILLIGVSIFLSTQFLLTDQHSSLIEVYYKQALTQKDLKTILNATEPNAIIITRYHDKLFFPERKVIVGTLDDNSLLIEYSKLIHRAPLYCFNFFWNTKDVDYLNNRKLKEFNLKLNLVKKVGEFGLYQLKSTLN